MPKTFSELIREARASIREVSPHETVQLKEQEPDAIIVDVRETTEWEQGHITGAIHVPRGHLESQIESAVPDHGRPIVLQCASGVRSVFATKTLEEMGYTNVASMAG